MVCDDGAVKVRGVGAVLVQCWLSGGAVMVPGNVTEMAQ